LTVTPPRAFPRFVPPGGNTIIPVSCLGHTVQSEIRVIRSILMYQRTNATDALVGPPQKCVATLGRSPPSYTSQLPSQLPLDPGSLPSPPGTKSWKRSVAAGPLAARPSLDEVGGKDPINRVGLKCPGQVSILGRPGGLGVLVYFVFQVSVQLIINFLAPGLASFVRPHILHHDFEGTEFNVGPDPYRKGSITGNQTKPRPTPPQGVPVQLSRPSVGQYILGPPLNHDARCRWY